MSYQAIDIALIAKQIAMRLDANSDDSGAGAIYDEASTDQSDYDATEIRDAIKIIDAEVIENILLTTGHSDANELKTTITAITTYGSNLPNHIGHIGSIEIQLSNASWEAGRLVKNLDVLRKIHQNVDSIYGTTAEREGYYYISEEGRAYFIGAGLRGQAGADTLIDLVTLRSPIKYTRTVIRGTLSFLRKDGIEAGFFDFWDGLYARDLNLIRSNAQSVPPLETYKRAGG